MAETKAIYCPFAFGGLYIYTDGSISPCWRSGLKISNKAYSDSIESSFQNLELIKIRRQMSAGEWPDSCGRCRNQEASGQKSERMKAISKYGDQSSGQLELFSPSLGNRCEKACLQCGNGSSSGWFKETEEMFKVMQPPPRNLLLGEMTPSIAWKALDLRNLKTIYLLATEAINQPALLDFFKLLDETGRLEEITFYFETAGGIVPSEKVSSWIKRIQNLHMAISVDGVGELNHYIRHPSPWEDVERSFDYWQDLASSRSSWNIKTETTLSLLNIIGLDELYDWSLQRGVGVPNLNEVYYPWFLSLDMLSESVRRELAQRNKWDKVRELLLRERSDRSDLLPPESRWLYLRKYLSLCEKNRKNSFYKVQPELFDLYFG